MRRGRAAVGSTVFFVLGPGIVAGLIPWALTGWRVRHARWHGKPLRGLGVILLAGGLLVLAQAFARFVGEGRGTPAPIAPPDRLVVGGAYRYVRNPIYLALVALIVGQALLLGQPGLLLYAAIVWLGSAVFVRWYEEPQLRRRFGASYDAYRQAVPAWWPHRPWKNLGKERR